MSISILTPTGNSNLTRIYRTKRRRDSGAVRDFLAELEALLQEIEEHVGFIVDEWLVKSDNGKPSYSHLPAPCCFISYKTFILILATVDQERDYEHIRRTYLPEMILDYHNALYYASHSLDKPTLLTQCMTVSIWVANIPHLTHSFTEAQRMSELVDCLALASKAMVLTDPKNDHTFHNGQTLGIWRISVSEEDEGALLQNRE